MTNLPAVDYLSNASRKSGEVKVGLEQVRDVVSEVPGYGAETQLTIASGVATAPEQVARVFSIESEGGAATDDLTNLALTNIPDGGLAWLRCANSAHVITIKHAAGSDGQFNTVDLDDLVLDDTKKWVLVKRTGLVIEIMGCFNFTSGATLKQKVAAKTSNYTITEADCGTLFTNAAAGADITLELPPAAQGLWYEFSTVAAFKMKVLTVGNDFIGDQGGAETATPGYLQSSAADGNTLRITAVSGTRWAVQTKGGTWTVDS
jgi:hypothetical protein